MTKVPLPQYTEQGFVRNSSEALYDGVIQDFNDAFGGGLSTNVKTPQGQLATAFAATIQAFQGFFLALVASIDPATSSGRMQDAIGRLFGMVRIKATSTVVTATCYGAPGVTIPSASLATTAGGDVYYALSSGTIGASGTVEIQFANSRLGAVDCPAGYLRNLSTIIAGWDSVRNLHDGIPGMDEETPKQFEVRRQATITKNSKSFVSSITSALLDVPNLIDCRVQDNASNADYNFKGVIIPARSIFVSVFGGTDMDVATAIHNEAPAGVAFADGTNTVVVEDTLNYQPPYPAYPITFTRAHQLAIAVKVYLNNIESAPSDVETQVRNAVGSVFLGTDSTRGRPKIGSTLLATRFVNAINDLGDWVSIESIKLGSAADDNAAHFTGSIEGNELTVTSVESGALAIGQAIDGALSGTVITGFVGDNVWTVSIGQSLPEDAYVAFDAVNNSTTARIDQIPSFTPNNVEVIFA